MAYASSRDEHSNSQKSASWTWGDSEDVIQQHQSECIAFNGISTGKQDKARKAYLEDLGYGWREEVIKESKIQCFRLEEKLQVVQRELVQQNVYVMNRFTELEDHISRLQRYIVTPAKSRDILQQNGIYISRHAGSTIDGEYAIRWKRQRSGSIDDADMPSRKRMRYK